MAAETKIPWPWSSDERNGTERILPKYSMMKIISKDRVAICLVAALPRKKTGVAIGEQRSGTTG
jgi:hypothetical protein